MATTALVSNSNGVIFFDESSERTLFCVDKQVKTFSKTNIQNWFPLIDDWQSVEFERDGDLVASVQVKYWTKKTASFCESLLGNLRDHDLEIEALKTIETELVPNVKTEDVLSILMIAPLRSPQYSEALANLALSLGCAATARLFEDTFTSQPLVNRFCSHWLSISSNEFANSSYTKQEFWVQLSDEGLMPKLVLADSQKTLLAEWGKLSFIPFFGGDIPNRKAISRVGSELANRIFGKQNYKLPELEEEKTGSKDDYSVAIPTHQKKQRVFDQIDEITRLISEGKDLRAKNFIYELVENQLGNNSSSAFATLSLCNLATQSKDLFRRDFEKICLDFALELSPVDPWTLIQHGDFQKRQGEFDEAIETLEKARSFASGETQDIATSCIADVWTCKRDFEEARKVYRSIEGWQDDPKVLTALVDILRYEEKYEEATTEYEDLKERFFDNPNLVGRALSGLAEVKKRQGQLQASLDILNSLVENDSVSTVIRLARINVIVLMGNLNKAFSESDTVVTAKPFNMHARIQRAAILGMLGDELNAVKQIPVWDTPTGLGEWQQQYVSGLLMLNLERYAEAKTQLVSRLEHTVANRGEDIFLRLAAAFTLIQDEKPNQARQILEVCSFTPNVYAQYIKKVVELSLALLEKDNAKKEKCLAEIRKAPVLSDLLNKFCNAVEQDDFELAKKTAVHCFLALTA